MEGYFTVGLGILCLLLIAILIVIIWCCCKKRCKKAILEEAPNYEKFTAEECREFADKYRLARDKYNRMADSYDRRQDAECTVEYCLEEAKKLDASYKEANQAAAQKFFIRNNANKPAHCIDLHGLYVNEAIELVKEKLKNARGLKEVIIITGKGLHSQNGPRIKPAVENFLIDNGYRFKEQRKNSGALIVDVQFKERHVLQV